MTRRSLTLGLGAALGASPALAKGRKPIVIAHRGASGERPEHTAAAYNLAIDQGCDFIEPDLVVTSDGQLVVRHENEISGTTDVATRPEFAARRATKIVDGQSVSGWFTEDFTLSELKTLRARERLPKLRPGSATFLDEPILTFAEVCAIARAGSRRSGRTIGIYPEMKHPAYFAGIGLPLEARMAAALQAEQLNSATATVFVQCFEVGPLKTLQRLSKARRVQLVDAGGGPADLPGVKYSEMLGPAGLKGVAAYADGLGPDKGLVVGEDLKATGLVAAAHAAGLKVHPWTVRAENLFLPKALWRGADPVAQGDATALLKALYAAGVDGLFSDFPGLAVAARDSAAR